MYLRMGKVDCQTFSFPVRSASFRNLDTALLMSSTLGW